MAKAPVVFMGGTFDPIHNGHLRTALELRQQLGVEQVCLIPSRVPVHRENPGCSAEQRLAMVELAVTDEQGLCADPREILADQPSYSLFTLQSLRQEKGPECPICMVMGMDAYLGLPKWHQWERFLDLCHLIVVMRPGYHLPEGELISEFTRRHQVENSASLLQRPCGGVYLQELTPLAISATQIRNTISAGNSPRYLLPDSVWQYIQEQNLYGLTN